MSIDLSKIIQNKLKFFKPGECFVTYGASRVCQWMNNDVREVAVAWPIKFEKYISQLNIESGYWQDTEKEFDEQIATEVAKTIKELHEDRIVIGFLGPSFFKIRDTAGVGIKITYGSFPYVWKTTMAELPKEF